VPGPPVPSSRLTSVTSLTPSLTTQQSFRAPQHVRVGAAASVAPLALPMARQLFLVALEMMMASERRDLADSDAGQLAALLEELRCTLREQQVPATHPRNAAGRAESHVQHA